MTPHAGHGRTKRQTQDGVIAAADSRASCSGLIACPAVQKIMPVHSHLVVTTSGSGADCMLWQRILAHECRLYHLRNHRRLSVGGAAKLLAYMLHPFKGTELCVALTLCGWDGGRGGASPPVEDLWVMEEKVTGWGGEEGCGSKGRKETRECAGQACEREGEGEAAGEARTEADEEQTALGQEASGVEEELGAKAERTESEREEDATHSRRVEDGGLSRASTTESSRAGATAAEQEVRQEPWAGGPRLYYVCSDGTCLQGELFSVGSGSPYAYSVLDCELRWGLSLSEAVSLAREAVYRATHRDAYSGNCVDVFYINSQGWRCREREDLREEYYREKEKRKMRQGEQEKCGMKHK
ncbi:proteasome subunit beta type-11a [Paramormyrops kingsleyae]|uniref:proteasome subunit beta type-11a n=1 Tax=Paramormyrops kingsleyae TaxID=1676925 RepID=UPI003B972ED3